MDNCLYIHPDNIRQARNELQLNLAVIARPDDFMEKNAQHCRQLIVETPQGVHTRCYLAEHQGVQFLLIYGRFERVRGTSTDIDFELTQAVINFLCIKRVVGMFVVGSIRPQDPARSVFIPHDFIAFGNYNQTSRRGQDFRNVDMMQPFCHHLRDMVVEAAIGVDFVVKDKGVYACFHGYPRIETHAELAMYEQLGCDIVGQTLDPEATLARESGCHYMALAVTIDDHEIRTRFLKNEAGATVDIDANIEVGRQRCFELFLRALPQLNNADIPSCSCEAQGKHVNTPSKYFYYRPPHLIAD